MWRKLADVLFWIGLAVYFGGMVTIGAIVAPAVFEVSKNAQLSMPGIVAPPLSMDRQVGGEIFGVILNRFAWVEAVGLVLMFIGLATWLMGRKLVRQSTWVLLILWSCVAVMTLYDAAALRPRVWSLRENVRQTAADHVSDAADAAWPEREEFDRLHVRSENLGSAKAYALLGMILAAGWRFRVRPNPAM